MQIKKTLIWFFFSLVVISVGLLATTGAVYAGMIRRWPSIYKRSQTSQLVADYSVDPDNMVELAPLKAALVFDLMAAGNVTATLRPGPLATLAAIASATPTFTPSPTPLPTDTPMPSPTATPSPTPSLTPTPTATSTPTFTPYPTIAPTFTDTPVVTVGPTIGPTSRPSEPKPTSRPPEPPPPTSRPPEPPS